MSVLYSLCEQWRDILCREPPIRFGGGRSVESPLHWAEEEFGTVGLYDGRLKERLMRIAQDFYNCPQAGISEACVGRRPGRWGRIVFFRIKK